MPQQPAVSVVIATYNRANFLRETIESVLNQSFKDFELIVVDDGSTDETRQIIKTYGSTVQAFYQNNRGPSAARNLGVRHARGSWIAIQDSDDVSAPHHLEVLYRNTQAYPECAMIFANGKYLNGPEHNRDEIIPTKKSRALAAQGVRLENIFDKSIVRLQASLISKAAYDALGGHDESLRVCMDLDLALRLFMNYRVKYADETLFYTRAISAATRSLG
jgi:glycosyltransferase involved in cell wall biosynthesis